MYVAIEACDQTPRAMPFDVLYRNVSKTFQRGLGEEHEVTDCIWGWSGQPGSHSRIVYDKKLLHIFVSHGNQQLYAVGYLRNKP